MQLNGRHVLVLGLGESGLAMARWCVRSGARVRVADTRQEPPFKAALEHSLGGVEFVAGEFDKRLLDSIDLVALSPGLSGGLMVVIHARANGIPVVGEIELFAAALRNAGVRPQTRVIAITGTNGKTTTTALTAHLCNAAGHRAIAAGNISPSALTALMAAEESGRQPDVWVLELSSFQLESLESLDADAAAVLNISDDHLDRYIDVGEYSSAKARIFSGDGVQVLNRQDRRVKRMALADRPVISFGLDAPGTSADYGIRPNRGEPWLVRGDSFLLPLSDLPIAGLHNAANAMAALALCEAVGLPLVALLSGLRSFKGLPHRVEKVAEIGGVIYYDDSKGTNVGATLAALKGLGPTLSSRRAEPTRRLPSLEREDGRDGSPLLGETTKDRSDPKIVLILGGDGKGQDFSPLKPAVRDHARAVVLIGRDGAKVGDALIGSGVPTRHAGDMDEAVRLCAAAAQAGDAVLLSPACASLDMFRNYEHRAEVFVAAVHALGAASA
ncbi:MAG: UDP-N-acetylmuramoyl-L-alanine--D-glutamate ligase [Rhodocyclaceae bacterium]|jgi:UDP-N-acetylmuramoylalanine--D-glutamate ligase|nr:UDP-N-acetylmuramoyl-L-alanine--D-glutamate ligase [Rhodocyclaceae bacterium]